MAKLTEGEKRAARKPGVGGKKPGLWRNVWQKRHREVTGGKGKSSAGGRKSPKPHTRTLADGRRIKVNHSKRR